MRTPPTPRDATRRASLAVLLVTGVAPGCAADRPPRRPDGRSQYSTLGSDLRRATPGETIPPPSLGVDLVGYRPGPARTTRETAPTGRP